ncbi:uncharacterized protein LOC106882208 isoform X2 [Octopus bimaculoides]|uniref:uncharacterized protein LOC106882208 isoform X2 n=1 Tax=Octopus bimaculoides TaxID=37653 RepID=UPI0022DFC4B2|nr:uncharacterized protein LOC106882208 isoform X2 [Octopus bimaculoides]
MLKLNPEERKQIQNFVSEAKRYEDSKMEKFNNIKTPTKKEEEQNVMLSLIERMKAFFQSLSPFFRHGSGKVLFLGLSLYLVFLHLRSLDCSHAGAPPLVKQIDPQDLFINIRFLV